VRWQVLKQPMELSPQQIAAFRALYPMNARPVQPLNGRLVEVSE
jgi:carbonic anhydrase